MVLVFGRAGSLCEVNQPLEDDGPGTGGAGTRDRSPARGCAVGCGVNPRSGVKRWCIMQGFLVPGRIASASSSRTSEPPCILVLHDGPR